MEVKIIFAESSNFAWGDIGSFCSGIGTLIIAFLGIGTLIFGSSFIGRWKQEKRLEKRSDIAEKVLNDLDMYYINILNWLERINWTYSRRSRQENPEYIQATEEEKKRLDRMYENDRYEASNYAKYASFEILNDLIKAKNHCKRLNNGELNKKFEKLKQMFQEMMGCLQAKHFHLNEFVVDKSQQCATLKEMADKLRDSYFVCQIEEKYTFIHKKLCEMLLYDEQ